MSVKYAFRLAEQGFTVVTLLLATESFILLIPHALRQAIWLGVYIVTAGLLAIHWRQALLVAARCKLLWLMLGVILLSILWSDAPSVSIRQSVALLGTTLFGFYLAVRYSLKQQLQLLAIVFGLIAGLSLVFALALPAYGLQGGQSWQGIYHHKNLLGRIMVLSMITFALNAYSVRSWRWLQWAGVGLSTGLLVLSNSKTALALVLVLFLLLPIYRLLRLYYKLAVPALIGTVLAAAGIFLGLVSQAEAIAGAAGKDLTFSGRTELWGYVLEMIQQRPWWGYGYGAFWRGWNGPSAWIWMLEPWHPMHSHSGYLDFCLELGVGGLLIFLLGFVLAMRRATLWISLTRTPEYFLPLTYLIFLLLYNLTESVFLLQNTIFWMLYVTISCSRLPQGVPQSDADAPAPAPTVARHGDPIPHV